MPLLFFYLIKLNPIFINSIIKKNNPTFFHILSAFFSGKYFNKVDCFCFTEQTLKAGARVDLPVQFHIDPAIANDRGLDDVETITLSYTFFKSAESKGKIPKRSAWTTKTSQPGTSGTAVN